MARTMPSSAFSLIEIAIVLVILSVILAGLLPSINESTRSDAIKVTMARMQMIEQALLSYRVANDRLPCPADLSEAIANADYGREAANEGSCTGGTPAANNVTGQAAYGAVPSKTLNLPDEVAFDGWGRRFTYRVDTRITAAAAFTTYPVTDTTIGTFTVKDQADGDRTTRAVYVLMSHGENGHGGYTKGGVAYDANSVNTHEQENCDCDVDATVDAGKDRQIVYQHMEQNAGGANNSFDDIVSYRIRSQLDVLVGAGAGTPPTCTGGSNALQWDGSNWVCAALP